MQHINFTSLDQEGSGIDAGCHLDGTYAILQGTAYETFGARQARATVDTLAQSIRAETNGNPLLGIGARSKSRGFMMRVDGTKVLPHGGEAFGIARDSPSGLRLLDGYTREAHSSSWVYAAKGDDVRTVRCSERYREGKERHHPRRPY